MPFGIKFLSTHGLSNFARMPIKFITQFGWKSFGSAKDIFPVPIQESFHYFIQNIFKTPFSLTMRFCVYFQIPWIFQIKETKDQIKQVFKTIKIKWWDKYTYTHADIKAVEAWLSENGHLQDLSKKRTSKFLNSKSKLLTSSAQTTSEADFQKLLQEAASSVRHPLLLL